MAEQEQVGNTEIVVENLNVPKWQQGLAQAINETYSYANNNLFYALVPTYLRDYMWRYIRPACQWLDGYVWSLHQSGISGIISTRLGSKLITGLTKQIVGEKVVFKLQDKSNDSYDALHFITKWAEEQNVMKAVYGGVGFSLGIGTALLKLNVSTDCKGKQQVWWEAVRFDNSFYLSSFKNEVKEATFVIRSYTDTREGKSNHQYFLVEHRYWKTYSKPDIVKKMDGTYETIHAVGDREPMVEFKVHRVIGTALNNVMPTDIAKSGVKWEELPTCIKDNIKKDYSVIRIDEPQRIPFTTLGVYPLLNGEIDLSVPTGTSFGESMLVGIQDDLITYEIASSYLIRDMYLGKGTVYLPKSMSLGDLTAQAAGMYMDNSVLQGIGESKIEMLKGVDPESQKAIVEQFNLRVDEWQRVKENALKNISVKWGMSPKILAAFLTNGQSAMTATQIDSEDDTCIAFIYHTRAYYKNTLNKALEETLNFYGYRTNISLDFASPSLINKDRLIERIIKLRDNGLISTEDAVREIYPDLDEEAMQKKIQDALNAESQKQMDTFNEMNDDGSFGNDDLLKGSTEPIE